VKWFGHALVCVLIAEIRNWLFSSSFCWFHAFYLGSNIAGRIRISIITNTVVLWYVFGFKAVLPPVVVIVTHEKQ
jgi:hypothetical protein